MVATHSVAAQSAAALRGTGPDSLSGQPLAGVSARHPVLVEAERQRIFSK